MKKRIRIQGILISLAVVLTISLPKFIFPYWKEEFLDEFLDVLGVSLVLFGFLFRIIARGYKEEKSSGGKNLVKDGPYYLIRNPMYFGTLLVGAGIVIALFKLWILLLFTIIYFSIYIPQVKKEEGLLSRRFGREYEDYCKTTPRYFPKIRYLLNLQGDISLKISWIKKEFFTFLAVITIILAVEIWEDVRLFGYIEFFKEILELLLVVLSFFMIITLFVKKKKIKILLIFLTTFFLTIGFAVLFTVFFDEAVIVKKDTVYHNPSSQKVVALTFDDGPSPIWTHRILDELKKAQVKATFFMLGEHVERYPEAAKRVAQEGHEIGNHSYDHHVLIYYKDREIEKEILDAQRAIKNVTGITTKYFRPPKAWLTEREKKKIKEMGYRIILWSLNSKDWVTFDEIPMIDYILRRIQPGDIILFHDSGGVFKTEGGDRHQTVETIFKLVEKLKEKGYKCVTITELLSNEATSSK